MIRTPFKHGSTHQPGRAWSFMGLLEHLCCFHWSCIVSYLLESTWLGSLVSKYIICYTISVRYEKYKSNVYPQWSHVSRCTQTRQKMYHHVLFEQVSYWVYLFHPFVLYWGHSLIEDIYPGLLAQLRYQNPMLCFYIIFTLAYMGSLIGCMLVHAIHRWMRRVSKTTVASIHTNWLNLTFRRPPLVVDKVGFKLGCFTQWSMDGPHIWTQKCLFTNTWYLY